MRDHFANFGEIIEAKIIKNEIGQSRGYAFVQMGDADAIRAIGELGKPLNNAIRAGPRGLDRIEEVLPPRDIEVHRGDAVTGRMV